MSYHSQSLLFRLPQLLRLELLGQRYNRRSLLHHRLNYNRLLRHPTHQISSLHASCCSLNSLRHLHFLSWRVSRHSFACTNIFSIKRRISHPSWAFLIRECRRSQQTGSRVESSSRTSCRSRSCQMSRTSRSWRLFFPTWWRIPPHFDYDRW